MSDFLMAIGLLCRWTLRCEWIYIKVALLLLLQSEVWQRRQTSSSISVCREASSYIKWRRFVTDQIGTQFYFFFRFIHLFFDSFFVFLNGITLLYRTNIPTFLFCILLYIFIVSCVSRSLVQGCQLLKRLSNFTFTWGFFIRGLPNRKIINLNDKWLLTLKN